MGYIELNISGTWEGDLEKEFIEILKTEFSDAIEKANRAVETSMRDILAQHIANDVYDAYTPKRYKRRYSAPGGLLDMPKHGFALNSGSGGVYIIYKPSGAHPTVSGWDNVGGDDLIGRIEKHDPEYEWLPKKGKGIPNRPFWQNFVDEMLDGGTMETVWTNAANGALPEGWTLDMSDGGIQRDAEDGSYG